MGIKLIRYICIVLLLSLSGPSYAVTVPNQFSSGQVASASDVNQNFGVLADAINEQADLLDTQADILSDQSERLASLQDLELPTVLGDLAAAITALTASVDSNADRLQALETAVQSQAETLEQLTSQTLVTLSTRQFFPANIKSFQLEIEQTACSGTFYLTHIQVSPDIRDDPGPNVTRKTFSARWGLEILLADTDARFSAITQGNTDADISVPGGIEVSSPILMNIYPVLALGFNTEQSMNFHLSGRCVLIQ